MYVDYRLTVNITRAKIQPLVCGKTYGRVCHSVVEWWRLGPSQAAVMRLHGLGAILHLRSGKPFKITFFVRVKQQL